MSRRTGIRRRAIINWWRAFRHDLGDCPRQRLGYPCEGTPGRCGWEKP